MQQKNNVHSCGAYTLFSVDIQSCLLFVLSGLFGYARLFPVYYICFYITSAYMRIQSKIKHSEYYKTDCVFNISRSSIWINHSGFGLLSTIAWPIVLIYMLKNSSLSDNYINKFSFLFFIGWIFAVITSFNYSDSYFENFELNYTGLNPNTIAIIIVVTCLFIMLYMKNTTIQKPIKAFVYLISAYALYRTKSRTSIFAFAPVLLMEFFLKKRIVKSKKTAIIIMAAIIAGGIIFPVIYVNLFTKGIISYDAQIFGKRIYSGRQYIWLNLWEYLQNNKNAYIWGTGYNETFYIGSFNLHNSYLMIFAQYGIPILIIYLFYLFKSVLNMFGKSNYITDIQFTCYQILIYVLMVGFGETILSYAPNMIYIAIAIGIGCRERSEKN